MSNTFNKADDGKQPLARLLDFTAILEASDVMEFGARKYGDSNWKEATDEDLKRYYSAALRHIQAAHKGNETDDESGWKHLSHAITCLAFIQYLQFERNNND